jgi:hypothetical protein
MIMIVVEKWKVDIYDDMMPAQPQQKPFRNFN